MINVPHNYKFCIVNAYSVKPKSSKVSVQKYEIRAYDPKIGGSAMYFRKRKNGYNPIMLKGILSGNGIPKWMKKEVQNLNKV